MDHPRATQDLAKLLHRGSSCADHICMTTTLYTVPLRLSVHDLSRREELRVLELEWHGAERRLRLVAGDDPSDVICEAIAPEIRVENGAIDWNDRWLVVSGWQHPTQQAATFFECIQADLRVSARQDDAESGTPLHFGFSA